MARSRTIRVGPPVKGLTDFPEHSGPEHSTIATNVEFRHGGVSTRKGSRRVLNNFYQDSGATARDCVVKLVKGIRGVTFGQVMVVGLVPLAGVEAFEERLILAYFTDGSHPAVGAADAPPLLSAQLRAPNRATVNVGPGFRWDACLFNHMTQANPLLVVCSDTRIDADPGADDATVYVAWWNQIPIMFEMTGVQRVSTAALLGIPFHKGVFAASRFADDPGNYVTVGLRARFCRSHGARLVLGNIGHVKAAGMPEGAESFLWFSNYGDLQGWPLDNLVPPLSGDTGPITGLGENGRDLIVFRRNSVSVFYHPGELPDNWSYRQVVRDRGCVAHSTIIDNVEGRTLFLAADGFYAFDGSPSLLYLSKPIERTLRRALEAQGAGAAWAVHYPAARQVWLAIPTAAATPDLIFVMDYGHAESAWGEGASPVWSIFEYQVGAWAAGAQKKRLCGMAAAGALDGALPQGTPFPTLFGIGQRASGTIDYEQFDVGDAIDEQGAATPRGFVSEWESGPVQFGKGDVDRWRFLRPTIRPQGNFSNTVWWRRDGQAYNGGGNDNGQSTTVSMAAQGGGNTLGAFVLGTDRIGAAEDHQVRVDVHSGGVGRYGRFGIRTNGSNSRKFDIRGVEIDVLDKGVRR